MSSDRASKSGALAIFMTLLAGFYMLLVRAAAGRIAVAIVLAVPAARCVLVIVFVALLAGLHMLLVRATAGVF
jgi:hypothetical protein